MAQWEQLIDRQLVNALARAGAGMGHFQNQPGGEPLWAWQGRQRVKVKESLALELPAVYGPPPARVILGDPDRPELGQLRHVETDRDQLVELHLQTADKQEKKPAAGYVLHVSESGDREVRKKFCQTISRAGLTGLCVPLIGAGDPNRMLKLAEIYLGLGQCYAGVMAASLLRIVDHLEDHFSIEDDPIVLVLSGPAIFPGLALAAIDQRISAIVVDLTDAPRCVFGPIGSPPMFRDLYRYLGPNPFLILTQCVGVRPMTIITHDFDPQCRWLTDEKSGLLSFQEQLAELAATYEAVNDSDRLRILGPDLPKPTMTDLVERVYQDCLNSEPA